jgi:hypothetical protein
MTPLRTLFLALALGLSGPAVAAEGDPTVEELLEATDDVARGESSIAVMEMHVKTDRYERTMKMRAYAEGTEKSLVRILEPAKDAGITTLKVGENLWNHLPKVDRTMKVPKGMMSGSWMGSHVTNDDLVRESRLSEDYTYQLTSRPDAEGQGNYVIELVPRPDAPVVWGKVVVEVRPDKIPVSVRYYDESGALVRTMTWSQVKEIEGRQVPTVMRIEPADDPGEFTELRYQSIDFDADIPPGTFSRQALER